MLFFLHQKNHNGKKEEILDTGENGNGNGNRGEKKNAKLALLNIWCSRQRFVSKKDSKHLQESTML
jgi:hypothetical protein